MLDYQRSEPGSLVYCGGERTREGHAADYYFEPRSEWDADGEVGERVTIEVSKGTSNFDVGEIIEESFSNRLL